MRNIALLSLAVLTISCYQSVETFLPVDRTRLLRGKTTVLVDDPALKCLANLDIKNYSHFSGVELIIEFYNSSALVESIDFFIKNTDSDKYEPFTDASLISSMSTRRHGPVLNDELIKEINNESETAANFRFPSDNFDWERLTLKYVIIFDNGGRKEINQELVFERAVFRQPLSR